ncbi:MAG: hypothetical protein ACKVS6_10100 [Planctomycetota bacterium]
MITKILLTFSFALPLALGAPGAVTNDASAGHTDTRPAPPVNPPNRPAPPGGGVIRPLPGGGESRPASRPGKRDPHKGPVKPQPPKPKPKPGGGAGGR